ncbi:MAG: hypothetical protein RLZZ196_834 [Bacteroidota bacterium]|jgi:hypothetical protein
MAFDDRWQSWLAMIKDDYTYIFKSSRLEQIFLIGLFDIDSSPFIENTNLMTYQAKIRGQLFDHYVWDNRTLAEAYSKGTKFDNVDFLDSLNENWRPIFVNSFTSSLGTDVVSSVDTFNPVSAFAHFTSSKFKSSVNFSAEGLTKNFDLPEDFENTTFLDFQQIIYKCMILPGFPLLCASTIDNSYLYGPLFVENCSISVVNNGAVNISLDLGGSKCLRTDIKNQEQLGDYETFRTLKYYDCMIDFEAHNTAKSFFKKMKTKNTNSIIKIAQMSLSAKNINIYSVTGNHGTDSVELGPRFTTISSRVVEGSITFIASSSEFLDKTQLENKGVTLYFGGPFLFILPNIVWQRPKITLTADGLYLHECKFLALATDNAMANAYKAYNNPEKFDISEFKLPEDNPTLDFKKLVEISWDTEDKKKKDSEK